MKSRKTLIYILFFGALVLAFFAALSRLIPGFTQVNIPPIGLVTPF
jgi:hypothetical protein